LCKKECGRRAGPQIDKITKEERKGKREAPLKKGKELEKKGHVLRKQHNAV